MLGDTRGCFSDLLNATTKCFETLYKQCMSLLTLQHTMCHVERGGTFLSLAKIMFQLIVIIWAWSNAFNDGRFKWKLLWSAPTIHQVFCGTSEEMDANPHVTTHHFLSGQVHEYHAWLALLAKNYMPIHSNHIGIEWCVARGSQTCLKCFETPQKQVPSHLTL